MFRLYSKLETIEDQRRKEVTETGSKSGKKSGTKESGGLETCLTTETNLTEKRKEK